MAELLMRPANAILTWLCLDYHQTLWYGDNLRVLRGVGGQERSGPRSRLVLTATGCKRPVATIRDC